MPYVIKNLETGLFFRTTPKIRFACDVEQSDHDRINEIKKQWTSEGDLHFGSFAQAKKYKTESKAKGGIGWLKGQGYKNLCIWKCKSKKQLAKEIEENIVTKDTVMFFGKYKGWRIGDIPYDYIKWLLNLPDLEIKYKPLHDCCKSLFKSNHQLINN